MKRSILAWIIMAITGGTAWAKVDLVTLPTRDTVQLTIYNSADLTLVRETRALTVKNGANKLQFSWSGTLIDPTSLEMKPLANADKIDIFDLAYPPRVRELGLWTIRSGVSGKVPVEISYLTSGLSWRAFYMGTLSGDEKTMKLEGYVRVTNNSGEDYENAQTRLIVGQVHLLDQIAELARRQYPHGRPGEEIRVVTGGLAGPGMEAKKELAAANVFIANKPEMITKEGLSEYFLYTIEGTETIPTGWSKRLLSFTADDVPVVNLYKYEEETYGSAVVRFLSFKNDKEHHLGQTPIPDGILKVYRGVDDQNHLSYAGQSSFRYIPVNEKVELNLGAVSNVTVKAVPMDYRTANYRLDDKGNIAGCDEIQTFKVTVKNTRDIPVKVELTRNLGTAYWDLAKNGDFDAYEKVDLDTVKFTLTLAPRSEKVFSYVLTSYHGTRQEERRK
jgi:hypothetical protein